MKKILLYTDTAQIGGAELQIFLLAKFLDREKFTPILCCSNYTSLDKWCAKFEKEGIKVLRLNVKHKHDPRHYFQIRKIIKTECIDILHAHIWNPASCRYALLIKNIPIIITEHDPFKLSTIKNYIKKSALKNVTKIVTVSENNKKVLEDLYPQFKDKMTVIHNGIDTNWWQSQLLRFTEEDYKDIKRNIFHSKENTLIITTIAELHERKGLKYLLNAIPPIVEIFPNTKFIIIGEGQEREKLEKLSQKLEIKNHVEFLGKQKGIPQLLKSSDIFCLPSRREAFGLVNTEAMITGLPIVASKVGGIPEIIENHLTGLLVEPENTKALENALLEMIKNKEMREKMGVAGKAKVLKNFNAKVMAEQYEKLY